MTGRFFLYLSIITTISVVGAVIAISESEKFRSFTDHDLLAFPKLNKDPEKVVKLVVITGETTMNFHQDQELKWVADDKFDYPISPRLIARILKEFSDMRLLEPKTKMPTRFKQVGTEFPNNAKASSVLVRLEDRDGEVVAETILGAQFKRSIAGIPQGTFIRGRGDQQVWLASGNIEIPDKLAGWLDTRVINIEPNDIKRIKFFSSSGPTMIIARPSKESKFALWNASGVKVIDESLEEHLSNNFSKLRFLDVWPREKQSILHSALYFNVETFSGGVVQGGLWRDKGKNLLVLDGDPFSTLQAPINGKENLKIYNELSKWVYSIPDWQADRFISSIEQLNGVVR